MNGLESEELSEKPRLGKILTGRVPDWKKPSANDCRVRENFEISVRRASGDRFTAKDPIGFKGGQANLFTYVFSNPTNYFDPTGTTCYWHQGSGDYVCVNNETGEVYAQGEGYSGAAQGENNPDLQDVVDMGPITQGDWLVGEPINKPESTGPYSRPLTPMPGNDVFDTFRDAHSFFAHGDNSTHTASHGCPIIPRTDREKILTGETLRVY